MQAIAIVVQDRLIQRFHYENKVREHWNKSGKFFFLISVMTWCLYYLTKHPEVQEKVFAELEEVLGDEDIKPQVASELKSVKCLFLNYV